MYLARGIAYEKLGQRALAVADFGEAQKRTTDEFYLGQAKSRLEDIEKRTAATD
jgi:hypothetical protein